MATAPNDPLDSTDAYGADLDYYAYPAYYFDSVEEDDFLAYIVGAPYDDWIERPKSVDEIEEKYPDHDYLYFYSPLGGTLALNWRKW